MERKPKQPMRLADFWVQRYQYKTGELHFDVYGQTVRRAMEAGQMVAVIMRINRHEHIPVLEEMTRTPRGGVYSSVATNVPKLHESLGPLVKWVEDEGLKWRIGFDVVGGVFRDIYSDWADFIVYWEPRLECGQNLMDFWLRHCTVKCLGTSSQKKFLLAICPFGIFSKKRLDDGLTRNWYETTRRAMLCGQKYAILCTLYAGVDFEFHPSEFQATSNKLLSSFDLTRVKGDVDIESGKFASLFEWTRTQGLEWFVILDHANQNWAYLAVSIEIR